MSKLKVLSLEALENTLRENNNRVQRQEFKGLPPVLYHYTTYNGLKGILETKKLWSTDYRSLNDPNEILLSMQKIDESINDIKQKNRKHDEIISAFQECFRKLFEDTLKNSLYIASFTENLDDPFCWRNYTDYGVGFAIGFKKSFFKPRDVEADTAETSFKFYPQKIIYSEKDFKTEIKALMNKFIPYFQGANENGKEAVIDLYIVMASHFLSLLSKYKHNTYKMENEHRLISTLLTVDNDTKLVEQLGLLNSRNNMNYDSIMNTAYGSYIDENYIRKQIFSHDYLKFDFDEIDNIYLSCGFSDIKAIDRHIHEEIIKDDQIKIKIIPSEFKFRS